MATTRCVIHSCLTGLAQTISFVHQYLNLADARSCDDGKVFDKHALVLLLFQVKLLVRIWSKQVPDLFVVNLDESATHQEFFLNVRLIINVTIDMGKRIWNDAAAIRARIAHHGVRLAAASLSVRKHGPVEASNY